MQIEDLVSLKKPTNKGRGHVHVYSIGGDECVGCEESNDQGRAAVLPVSLC